MRNRTMVFLSVLVSRNQKYGPAKSAAFGVSYSGVARQTTAAQTCGVVSVLGRIGILNIYNYTIYYTVKLAMNSIF